MMKHLLTMLLFTAFVFNAQAQAPQGIPYQAAARNSSGGILASTAISLRFTIRDSVATGAIKYRETFSVTTTAQGMFSLNVGQGSVVSGSFAGINWGANAKFMQVEMDPAGGASYIDMGTNQLMSVPYALNSGSVQLKVSATGDTLYSGGGNFVIIPGLSAANSAPFAGTITGASTVCAGSTITLANTVTGGSWSSAGTAVATIGSTGIVTGVAAGTTTISYAVTNSFGTSYATKVVTVNPLPSAGTITGADGVCVSATNTLTSAVSGGTWNSSNTTILTVSSTGVVTGVAAGTATVSYTVTNSCGTAVATKVQTVNLASSIVGITGSGTVCTGSTTTLSHVTAGGTWSSNATGIATVDSTGVVTGVAAGTATISYIVHFAFCGASSAYATKVVTVSTTPSVGTITGTATVCVGSTTSLSNTTTGGAWSSGATGVATVGSTGVVTGVSAGTAIISYTVTNGCGATTSTKVVTVNPLPNAGTITGPSTVCVGSTVTLSNTATGGVWSSSYPASLTVSTTGVVTGVAYGSPAVYYSVTNGCGGATAYLLMTVNPLPSAGTITGTATVTVGSTTTLSNAITGGTWSSSATGIATIGSTGVVTGVAAGTVTISYTVTNSCGSAVATQVVTISALTVGSSFGGGVVAYILQVGDPGYVAGETHGIIAAPSDQSTSIVWGCYGTTVGGTSTALGTGAANTTIISAACGAGTAARLCADLVLGGYSDWYLPSHTELQKLYINRSYIGGFTTGMYWSSSENGAGNAWNLYFLNGATNLGMYTKANANYVRAIRSF